MKRRDFLTAAATAGFAGAIGPRLARGAVPCPPPALSVAGGQSVSTACTSASNGGAAPTWWKNLAPGNWAAIANGAGRRLTDVVPNPLPVSGYLGGAISDLAADWCSAAVNQATGEYMFIAHGGHSSWAGNEGYALAVRTESPGWKRLTDPTPSSHWPDFTKEGDGRMLDGRPRSMHSSPEIYANGRVWFPILNSVSSGAGGGVNRLMSFNLNHSGLVAARAAGAPLAWTASNLGPWEDWGQVMDSKTGSVLNLNTYIFGSSVFDTKTGKIWYLGGKGEVDVYAISIDTNNVSASSPPKTQTWHWAPSFPTGEFDTWTFCADDLRLVVAGDAYRQHIAVMNADDPSAGWTKANVSGTGYYGAYQETVGYVFAGAAYIPQNNCAAIGDPKQIGRTIYKLQIPTKIVSGKKVYDPSGTWVWSTINGGGTGPDNVPGGQTYARWNVIRDMGDGNTAIIVCSDVNAVHIYKVPSSGL
jgi:hypothetical protein